jgi:3'(2'), 5'-bisphosphate nucleotidase
MHKRATEVAQTLARQAGGILLGYFGKFLPVEQKPGNEPVTEADRKANEHIVAGLRAAFPDDAILSEELPEEADWRAAQRVWMVDPMDGTKDFIADHHGFSVMIGLCQAHQPVLGVVYHPSEDRMYWSVVGQGAWVDDAQGQQELHVSQIADLANARLVSSRSNRSALTEQIRSSLGVADDRPFGSVGLKLAMIAAGQREIYVNPGNRSKLWDVCAPHVILAEAGGRLTDARGNEIDYAGDLSNHHGLLASNGILHPAALERVRPLLRV